MDKFAEWWSVYQHKTEEERLINYESLTRVERFNLRQSFLKDGWCDLFCQNHIDDCLDTIKSKHSIDLWDLRIKVLRKNRTFVIEKSVWEEIEKMIIEYEPLFNSDVLFGGLRIKPWGRKKQYVVIAQRRGS